MPRLFPERHFDNFYLEILTFLTSGQQSRGNVSKSRESCTRGKGVVPSKRSRRFLTLVFTNFRSRSWWRVRSTWSAGSWAWLIPTCGSGKCPRVRSPRRKKCPSGIATSKKTPTFMFAKDSEVICLILGQHPSGLLRLVASRVIAIEWFDLTGKQPVSRFT